MVFNWLGRSLSSNAQIYQKSTLLIPKQLLLFLVVCCFLDYFLTEHRRPARNTIFFLVNKALCWLHNTSLYRIPPVHLKRDIKKNGSRDSSGVYCQQCYRNPGPQRCHIQVRDVTTQIFRKNSLIRLFLLAWLPENICLRKQYTMKEKNYFSETRRLLFLSLERRIVHD